MGWVEILTPFFVLHGGVSPWALGSGGTLSAPYYISRVQIEFSDPDPPGLWDLVWIFFKNNCRFVWICHIFILH